VGAEVVGGDQVERLARFRLTVVATPLELLTFPVSWLLKGGQFRSPIPVSPVWGPVFLFCDVAPLVLVWLAWVRGQRINNSLLFRL
jgi:hypothetical protein